MAADETSSAASTNMAAPVATAAPAAENTGDKQNNGERKANGNRNGDSRRGGGRGGRGGRGNDRQGGGKRKQGGQGSGKGDVPDIRERIQRNRDAKRRKVIEEEVDGKSYMSINFTPEEIASEERRPKRKVAVLIGYAGTGYHGIQINHKEKTIEGDIFAAFVAAGAISKVNADDPKKSSLVRCARTDKGVHAAGNVLSLKLIVEDEDIVEKINAHLPEQIRIWGIQRTVNGFSCYQACDSRWYEYLMPSYSLLPPHPQSFLGKKIAESTKAKGVEHEYAERLDDVKGFWEEVEKNDIEPILAKLSPEVREEVVRKFHASTDQELNEDQPGKKEPKKEKKGEDNEDIEMVDNAEENKASDETAPAPQEKEAKTEKEPNPVDIALREVKTAYVTAKRRYRATPERIEKLQQALNLYLGTHNFHNYTVLKSFKDASAKRHIKSFEINKTPIQIRDTEWLSLKVHGQSFMMHQIRKMVAMAVMVVRCGAPLMVIHESYGPRRISIPKAPGLGLMLERPMFTEYNKKAKSFEKEPIDFSQYEDQITKFKDDHIYRRMFEVEENENAFHLFFNQVDNFRTDYFLWVTAGGVDASHERSDRTERVPKALEAELGDEADGVVETET
ncbi:pseudouridine synthase [Podospora australis]|uniref:tRNA pseudouridine synthase 1 n=1 Tax=Podospora australis TaxID=1536484 RepID=A0AAN6WUR4_9PEZI|nr:pseudouridine synthase [Podospora australis]